MGGSNLGGVILNIAVGPTSCLLDFCKAEFRDSSRARSDKR